MESIPYRINRIQTEQFAIFPNKFMNGKEVNIQVNFNFGINNELSNIKCTGSFQYIQDENLLLTTVVNCFFMIGPEGSEEIRKKGRLSVEFLRYVATIVTGTIRGIIHVHTEGTPLNALVLPPINLVNTIKEDMIIQEKS